MSFVGLQRMGITLRPFDNPPPAGDVSSPFDAPLADTLRRLERELRMLDADQIVLQLGYRDSDLRIDGMPRANAKLNHDAVALSFQSKWGPLRYVTNEFRARYYRAGGEGWHHNLRAIALAMEALRKVDRYGVSKRGEQYTGWRALPQSTDAIDHLTTRHAARAFIDEQYGGDLRRALFESHPDHGGDSSEFRKVQRCRELLKGVA